MALILKCCSEREVHEGSELNAPICSRQLFTLTSASNLKKFSNKTRFALHTCATCAELPSNISTLVKLNLILQQGRWVLPKMQQIFANFRFCLEISQEITKIPNLKNVFCYKYSTMCFYKCIVDRVGR